MPNALAREKSPYLLQHADNPVDWLPWGEEAFARARAEDKPIFLSVGYSTCHWCHVMAHESFENVAVAQLLNAHFVPIKVDREERPDVDRVYMTFVQAATGQGGWPMSVWLTPELKPFFGGTYYPPEDRYGRPGFATLLQKLAEAWRNERDKILAEGEQVAESLRRFAEPAQAGPPAPAVELTLAPLQKAFGQLRAAFDDEHGGFGGAPKFPRPVNFNLLFRIAAGQGVASRVGQAAVRMAAFTLQKMAGGGMHDHVGGGFHRYSVDESWQVPHFEKMLYDQAQLAVSYLEAWQAAGQPAFAWVARGIFDYAARDLTNSAGGFYSAEDADSALPEAAGDQPPVAGARAEPHAEGAFYVWTKAGLEATLAEPAAGGAHSPRGMPLAEFFCAHYSVKDGGNVPHARDPQREFTGKNILAQAQPLATTAQQFGLTPEAADEKLASALERVREARAHRPRPQLDDKIITAWNGLMISALAKGAQVLGEPGLAARAVRAAEFLQRELHDPERGVLFRSHRGGRGAVEGFADDYAFLIQGLLDLYEAMFEVRWLRWAERLQAKMDGLFWDEAAGGYFNTQAGDASILIRLKENYDGAEPSANSVAALNLLRLDAMIGGHQPDPHQPGHRDRALRTIGALRRQWENAPYALPQMLVAIEFALAPPRQVVLAGTPGTADFDALARVVHTHFGPRCVLLAAGGDSSIQAGIDEDQRWLASRAPFLAGAKPSDGRAAAYVCENFTCQLPTEDPEELRRLLA